MDSLKRVGLCAALCVGLLGGEFEIGTAEPLPLESAIQKGLQNSQTVEGAKYELDEADQLVREAWSNVLPQVRMDATYQRNTVTQEAFFPASIFYPAAPSDQLIPVRFGSDNIWSAGLHLNQTLFEMDVFIGLGAAGRFRKLQHERYRGSSLDALLALRRAYVGALLAEEDRRLVEDRIRRVRQTRDEARLMYEAGFTGEFDVIRLNVQLANLEPDLGRVENIAGAARRQLLVEMGLDPTRDVALVGNLGELDVSPGAVNSEENQGLLVYCGDPKLWGLTFEETYAIAFERRSNLRQARLNISVEEARVGVNQADYLPTVSLFGSYGLNAQENADPNFFGEDDQHRSTFGFVGLRLEMPVFEGFARGARVQQSKAVVRQNETMLTRLEHEVANEIQFLLDEIAVARSRAEIQRVAVREAKRGFDIASAEFREGIGTRLQVTEADVALAESEFNYASAVHDYLLGLSRLDQSVGSVSEEVLALAPQLALQFDEKEKKK
jgi:outer membrane protein TolC